MEKHSILSSSSFGRRVAEEEAEQFASYFVETDHWTRLFSGDIDIVYGAKGSGKSALYSLLLSKASQLKANGILSVAAENPRETLENPGSSRENRVVTQGQDWVDGWQAARIHRLRAEHSQEAHQAGEVSR